MKVVQARQGDLLFQKVRNKPVKYTLHKTNVLAYGEVTGHRHQVTFPPFEDLDCLVDEKGDIYLHSDSQDIVIGHDEHQQITLPSGEWFRMTRQREYDPIAAEKERQVQD